MEIAGAAGGGKGEVEGGTVSWEGVGVLLDGDEARAERGEGVGTMFLGEGITFAEGRPGEAGIF